MIWKFQNSGKAGACKIKTGFKDFVNGAIVHSFMLLHKSHLSLFEVLPDI